MEVGKARLLAEGAVAAVGFELAGLGNVEVNGVPDVAVGASALTIKVDREKIVHYPQWHPPAIVFFAIVA